eukprot:183524_1
MSLGLTPPWKQSTPMMRVSTPWKETKSTNKVNPMPRTPRDLEDQAAIEAWIWYNLPMVPKRSINKRTLCSDSELEHQLMAAKQKIVDLKIDGNKAKDQLMAAEQKIDGSKAAQVRRNSKETQIINELKCESAANKIDSMENHDIAKVLDFDFI